MSDIFTIIESGIGQWRSAGIDTDGLPLTLNFHDDVAISPLEAIFDGRVTRVDTNLDMAFLDLGNGLTGALNFRRARLLVKTQTHSISDCVCEGDLIRVQVVSEPSALENKALPVTPRPRITGRYAVAETGKARLNLSKDLTHKQTAALKTALGPVVTDVAIIIRGRAGHAPVEAVVQEVVALQQALTTKPDGPRLIHTWAPAEKALLSLKDDSCDIVADGHATLSTLKTISNKIWPDLTPRLQLYKGNHAFEELGVEEAIEEALAPQITLPSGGWINITPTPALTAVDVNLGGALKHMAANEAILLTNMEATLAVAHHLEFQDIGGIIIIDYINMSSKGSTRELMHHIETTFRESPVPVQHTGLSQFGLVEFTRKRSGLSLRDRLEQQHAPMARPAAQALTLLQKAKCLGTGADHGDLILEASHATLTWLEAHSTLITALKEATQRTIVLEAKTTIDAYIRPADKPAGKKGA